MSTGRNRGAWIWVAIAAVALVSVTCAEAGLEGAKAYAHPVLKLLARGHSHPPVANAGIPRQSPRFSGRRAPAFVSSAGVSGAFCFVPVFFVGLLLPLRPRSGASHDTCRRAPMAPSHSASFQRPPPQLA